MMSLDLGILQIKNLLEQYKHGKPIKYLELGISDFGYLKESVDFLLKEDYFNEYELAFLSNIFESCKNKLMEKSQFIKNENVLCFKNRDSFLEQLLFIRTAYKDLSVIDYFLEQKGEFLNRRSVEYDYNILQLVPYMILKYRDDIILLEKKKGDSRLINFIDFPAGHCNTEKIIDTVYQELEQELNIKKYLIKNIQYIDIIPPVEDRFSVSYYHLGLITLVELYDCCVIVNGEPDRSNIISYNSIRHDPGKIRFMSNWCTYSMIQYLNYINNK